MRYLLAAFIAVLLAACTAVEPRQQALYSPLLSASDVEEIRALVAKRPDIRQPIYEIATEDQRRDRAIVRTGRWREVGDQADYFTVEKRRGRWHIVTPIQQDRLKRVIPSVEACEPRSNQAIQRTASQPVSHLMTICHPPDYRESRFTGLAVADLVSR